MKYGYLLSMIAAAALLSGCQTDTSDNHAGEVENPQKAVKQADRSTSDTGSESTSSDKSTQTLEKNRENGGDRLATSDTPQKAGWYMRTVVTAFTPNGQVIKHNTAGVFGELDDSSDAKDRHDIESIGEAVFQVRFVNDSLDLNKEYFSDYRAYKSSTPEREVWTFLVKNETGMDLSDAEFTIDVEAPKEILRRIDHSGYVEKPESDRSLLERLTLVDADNGQTYSYDEVKNQTFSMQGKKVRVFRWVLGEVKDSDLSPLGHIKTASSAPRRTTRSAAATTTATLKTSKFGLPPSI